MAWRWVIAATFVPCIGWYHSSTQVIVATWRAATSRPYGHAGGWFRSTTQVVVATFPERHTGRSLRFRWRVVVFNRGIRRTGGIALQIAETSGTKVKLPPRKNCQLSIVNSDITVNFQLKLHPLARLLLISARASVASGAVVSWLARSLRLRMPQSLPFSRMGKRRICWRPMRWAATPASMSGRA